MRDIKIFISHRIEFDSRTIDNPLFFPVRCGAIDDQRTNKTIPGDDTGDNVSELRVSFGEFTVQYWAWKNVEADYYGILHYRRYFSFSPCLYTNTEHDQIIDPFLDDGAIKRYKLMDAERMRNLIEAHDAIVNKTTHVRGFKNKSGPAKTVYDRWVSWHNMEKTSLDLLVTLIKEMRPEYLQSAQDYLAGSYHRGNNCFVFCRELFFQYCEFVYDILFELQRRLKISESNKIYPRTPSFLGEIMYGIFIYHLQNKKKFSIKELQLVFFENPRPTSNSMLHTLKRFILLTGETRIRRFRYAMLPIGSRRREMLKLIYQSIKTNPH